MTRLKLPALTEVTVATRLQAEEPVAALLEKIYRRRPGSYHKAGTNRVQVTAYVKKSDAGSLQRLRAGLVSLAKLGLETGPATIRIRRLPAKNWANAWKHHFPPIEIGGALLIKPPWGKSTRRRNQAVVVLNPGLSFGTGQHPTTRFCLEQIEAESKAAGPHGPHGRSFLDIGTGSGVLAIAAAKLGYGPILAVDSDPGAVARARQNAVKNGVADKIFFCHEAIGGWPIRSSAKYGLICANLTADLLLENALRIRNRLAKGGLLVLAGVLSKEFHALQKAYGLLGLGLSRARTEKEWRSGVFRWSLETASVVSKKYRQLQSLPQADEFLNRVGLPGVKEGTVAGKGVGIIYAAPKVERKVGDYDKNSGSDHRSHPQHQASLQAGG